MTLEFGKVTNQIERMGEYLAQSQEEERPKVEIALQLLETFRDEKYLPYILSRVQDAVDKDAGYRGARPLNEPIANVYAPAPLPNAATIIATDGSQILPDPHGAALYYLINTGSMVVYHGSGLPPVIHTEPALFYEIGNLFNKEKTMISPTIIAARRSVAEMAALAERAWHEHERARPLVALLDGPLLFVMGSEVPERSLLRRTYFDAMTRLREIDGVLAGYTDKPRSQFVISMLYLLSLHEEDVTSRKLANNGPIEGLRDASIFRYLLEPGERTALFVQMSPTNKEFRNFGSDAHEIVFFYLNVAAPGSGPKLARVEVPMWVAQNKPLVAQAQALIYHQCQQVVVRYPYVLTRAHEIAVVRRDEAEQLDMMVRVTMTRMGLETAKSEKQQGKEAARSYKTRFRMGE